MTGSRSDADADAATASAHNWRMRSSRRRVGTIKENATALMFQAIQYFQYIVNIQTVLLIPQPAFRILQPVWENEVLSPEEVATIKAEIERLEKARRDCNDGGIRKRIDAWIEEHKEKLESHRVRRPK
jgi:hypothetical protein